MTGPTDDTRLPLGKITFDQTRELLGLSTKPDREDGFHVTEFQGNFVVSIFDDNDLVTYDRATVTHPEHGRIVVNRPRHMPTGSRSRYSCLKAIF